MLAVLAHYDLHFVLLACEGQYGGHAVVNITASLSVHFGGVYRAKDGFNPKSIRNASPKLEIVCPTTRKPNLQTHKPLKSTRNRKMNPRTQRCA